MKFVMEVRENINTEVLVYWKYQIKVSKLIKFIKVTKKKVEEEEVDYFNQASQATETTCKEQNKIK